MQQLESSPIVTSNQIMSSMMISVKIEKPCHGRIREENRYEISEIEINSILFQHSYQMEQQNC